MLSSIEGAGSGGRVDAAEGSRGRARVAYVTSSELSLEEGAAIAYRGALPAGAPPLARFASEHAAALRTEFQALGRGVAPLTVDQLDPVAQRVIDGARHEGATRGGDPAVLIKLRLQRSRADHAPGDA